MTVGHPFSPNFSSSLRLLSSQSFSSKPFVHPNFNKLRTPWKKKTVLPLLLMLATFSFPAFDAKKDCWQKSVSTWNHKYPMYCNKGVIFQMKKTIAGQPEWNMCIRRTKSHTAKQEIELPTLKHMTEVFPFVQDILLCLILISNHLLLHASESWYFRCRVFLLKGPLIKRF